MGRRKGGQRKHSMRKKGAWRELIEKMPLDPTGKRPWRGKDELEQQRIVEARRAKVHDWFASRGVRHP